MIHLLAQAADAADAPTTWAGLVAAFAGRPDVQALIAFAVAAAGAYARAWVKRKLTALDALSEAVERANGSAAPVREHLATLPEETKDELRKVRERTTTRLARDKAAE